MQGRTTRNTTRGTRLPAASAWAPVAPPSRAYSSPARAAPVVRCAALSSAAATGRRRNARSPATIASGATTTPNGQPRSRIAYADAEDVGGEAVARESDAIAAGQRADHDKHHDFSRVIRAERHTSRRERRQACGNGRHGTERDEPPYQEARRRFEAGEGTHGQARSKVGPLAWPVKRD